MLTLLLLVPWLLTVGALLVIIVRNGFGGDVEVDEDEEEYFGTHVHTIRVAMYDDKAYWVDDNIFYEAELTSEPDFSTARPIDTMTMDSKELNKLLSVLDDLQESRADDEEE